MDSMPEIGREYFWDTPKSSPGKGLTLIVRVLRFPHPVVDPLDLQLMAGQVRGLVEGEEMWVPISELREILE